MFSRELVCGTGPLGEAAGAEVAGIIAAGDAEHMRALLASASSIMFDSAFGDSDDGFYTTSWGRLEKSTLGHVQEPSIFQQKRTLLGAREG